jgi:hypothetical protein
MSLGALGFRLRPLAKVPGVMMAGVQIVQA